MPGARDTALGALIQFRRDGAWPDLYLKQEAARLSPEDAALATTITYGTLQNRELIDFYISCFSSMKLKKVMPQVLDAIRIGVYQLLFLDKIPPSAAVNESVKLVKQKANPRAAAFANAVLRKISTQRDALPQLPQDDPVQYLSVRYSHPVWFVRRMLQVLGREECESLLQANNAPVEAAARVNALKVDRASLLQELGAAAHAHPAVEDAVIIDDMKTALRSRAFADGQFYVQDIASQLAVLALSPQPGSNVMDLCAAPGGKSLLAAQLMGNKGELLATDLHAHKVDILEKNAEKYGVSILRAAPMDASRLLQSRVNTADYIVCDVPCSGMGIIRKKPDIRFKDEACDLPQLQYQILCNAAAYLKQGGCLVYSTCTVLPQENEAVVQRFLKEHPELSLEGFELPVAGKVPEGMVTLYPHRHGTDGFFIAKLRKA